MSSYFLTSLFVTEPNILTYLWAQPHSCGTMRLQLGNG